MDTGWTLFLRRKVPDSEGFLQAMRELYVEDLESIPPPLRSMLTTEEQTIAGGEGGESEIRHRQRDPLLLPLAANEQQQRILKLAQRHPGVAVQGPPGTGKSHTIANLISHYVAYGKRVLVVAEKEQALKVLADKVPEGIRDLTLRPRRRRGGSETTRPVHFQDPEPSRTGRSGGRGCPDPRADSVSRRTRPGAMPMSPPSCCGPGGRRSPNCRAAGPSPRPSHRRPPRHGSPRTSTSSATSLTRWRHRSRCR